jgi:4-amino-4-deoxy-L-arabinose transferase-like glycosyltransferase
MTYNAWTTSYTEKKYGLALKNHLRTPLYPLFLSALWLPNYLLDKTSFEQNKIFDLNLNHVIFVQIILQLLTGLILFYLAYQITNHFWLSLIPMALLEFEVNYFSMSHSFWVESFLLFILSLHLLSFYLLLKKADLKHLFLTGFSLGLLALTKPSFSLLFIPFIIVLFFAYPVKTFIKNIGFLLFIYLLTLSPWLIRNKVVYDSWALSSQFGYNMALYNLRAVKPLDMTFEEELNYTHDLAYQENIIPKDGPFPPFKYSQFLTKWSFTYLQKNDLLDDYLKVCFLNSYQHFLNDEPFFLFQLTNHKFTDRYFQTTKEKYTTAEETIQLIHNGYRNIWYLLFYGLSIIGLFSYFYHFRKSKFSTYENVFYFYLLLSLLYLIAVSAPINFSRTRIPEFVFMSFFCLLGLHFIKNRILILKSKKS